MSVKHFPIHAVLTMRTGQVWGSFGDAHELAEHVLGRSIWTHEFADPAIGDEIRAALEIQAADVVPTQAGSDLFTSGLVGLSREDKMAHVTRVALIVARRIGRDSVAIRKGSTERHEDPIGSYCRIRGMAQ